MKLTKNLNKNFNYLYFFFVIIVIVKLFSINIIHKKRELPIEPDDAYTYITHSFLIYEDFDRNKETMLSLKDTVYSTYNDLLNSSSSNPQNTAEVISFGRFFNQSYFLYSKTFGFIKKNFEIDDIKLWWIFNYLSQILILLSALLFVQRFLPTKKNLYKLITLISSFFFILSVPHQFMATPMTIGTSILLIGICLSLNNNKYFNFIGPILVFLSLHFHPGTFLIASIFIGTYFVMYIIYKKENLNYLIKITFPVILALILEQCFFLLESNRYLGVFGTRFMGQEIAKINTLIEIFNFNWPGTKEKFISMLYPLTPFFFHKNFIIFFIYIVSVYVTYKKNKELFILNCFVFLQIVIGCFYIVTYNHPANLIFYQMQGMIPILSVTFFNMYFFFFEKLNQKFNIKNSYILIAFVMIIYLNNLSDYYKTMKIRIKRANYENITSEIREFNKKHILNENDALIIGDELVLFMYLSFNKNIKIYLDNEMIKKDKVWSYKNNMYKSKGYIGKIHKNKEIQKTIRYGQNSATFANIKKYKNFYFLYN